jgi:uncharacterized membrane protein YeaQ/YmgE (transglycosylase-associated protein family)
MRKRISLNIGGYAGAVVGVIGALVFSYVSSGKLSFSQETLAPIVPALVGGAVLGHVGWSFIFPPTT